MAPEAASSRSPRRGVRASLSLLSALAALACAAGAATAETAPLPPPVAAGRFSVPASAGQLVVVSSPRRDPAGHLATLRGYRRAGPAASWRRAFGPWTVEIGSSGLRDIRREGDGSTPTGVFAFGARIYGIQPNTGGLHAAYRRLGCGDWWDEDPFSPRYNRFVHVACNSSPPFGAGSEALWRQETAYPYFAVIDFNEHPTIAGAHARGSGIFLHAWVGGPTEGCVALPVGRLLRVLRWIRPAQHPVIEIGTRAQVGGTTGE